jgi:3-oxoacyl-[acyl-carrier protein] reductase
MAEPHLAQAPVVVTGVGGRGQAGEAVARAFALHGAIVHCLGRDTGVRERVDELRAEGLQAYAHTVDLADFVATARVANEVAEAHRGRVAVVIGLAGGFAVSGPVAASEPGVFEKQISINLTTAYSTARAFAPPVRAAAGVFVFVSAAAVLAGGKSAGISAYAMAKAGVAELTRTFAEEEREHGVRVYAIAPTAIRTAANVASMGEKVRYIEREDFAATIIAMTRPSFAV